MGIRRGSTPEHTFTLPFVVPDGASLRIVYAQEDTMAPDGYRIILEKTEADCSVSTDGGTTIIATTLSSDDTLRFDCNKHYNAGRAEVPAVFIQIGVETVDGRKMWSKEIKTTVKRCLRKDGVIKNVLL